MTWLRFVVVIDCFEESSWLLIVVGEVNALNVL